MREKREYSSPKVDFQVVSLKREIANRCWAHAKKDGEQLYYNTEGKGYVIFEVYGADDCSGSGGIKYHIIGTGSNSGDLSSEEDMAARAKFDVWWNNRGSNEGSNFAGGSDYSETKPNPSWS